MKVGVSSIDIWLVAHWGKAAKQTFSGKFNIKLFVMMLVLQICTLRARWCHSSSSSIYSIKYILKCTVECYFRVSRRIKAWSYLKVNLPKIHYITSNRNNSSKIIPCTRIDLIRKCFKQLLRGQMAWIFGVVIIALVSKVRLCIYLLPCMRLNAVARIRFPGYLALRKIDAFSKVPLLTACSFITTPCIQAHVSLATLNIFISFQIKLQQMKLY